MCKVKRSPRNAELVFGFPHQIWGGAPGFLYVDHNALAFALALWEPESDTGRAIPPLGAA